MISDNYWHSEDSQVNVGTKDNDSQQVIYCGIMKTHNWAIAKDKSWSVLQYIYFVVKWLGNMRTDYERTEIHREQRKPRLHWHTVELSPDGIVGMLFLNFVAENIPYQNFFTNCTHGLLRISNHQEDRDWRQWLSES